MKRFLLFAFAAIIAAASCQKETLDGGVPAGETAEVTFTINVPEGLQTKAIADGSNATELLYAVYNADKTKHITSLDGVTPVATTIDGKRGWTLKLTLVKNYTYNIFFWAQAPVAAGQTGPYEFDKTSGKVTVKYDGSANDEKRDAFCYLATVPVPADVRTFVPNGGKPFELRRPFAQINFGAADYKAITELGLAMTSTIEMSGLPDTYNFLTGKVSGNATTSLALAQIPAQMTPAEKLTVNGDSDTYGYVGMNYILAPENTYNTDGSVVVDRVTKEIKATFAYNNETVEIDVPNVPYQRNFRTNIVGNFFSGDVDIQVIIVEDFYKPDVVVMTETLKVDTPSTSQNILAYENISVNTDGAAVELYSTYPSLFLYNGKFDADNGVVLYESNTVILSNCDFTLPAGGYIVDNQSSDTTIQVILWNVKVNGVLLDSTNAGQYLNNVGTYFFNGSEITKDDIN